ncbi:LEAF RUST 10 DISEASE-RESISTANCE LOCUS RECEPTOR-LIKE PROTEIN KINASE-like 2.4 isoform X1 [Castanea sativa]|uniref:LEAF RUST 10 DISEASE-RESISTANCE LOCUS RECEPTOR-LIKE PROTEIN KINASE-like 2.4 isoform X1 n=2 Tax=Castanea sativa TaxID=21020 RepID=UPI003F649E06
MRGHDPSQEMNSRLLSSSPNSLVYSFFIFFIFINNIDLSLCKDDSYSNCSKNIFSCGNINNISFPFWGENYTGCGYPGLKLNCTENVTTMEIMNVTYRVLDVNLSAQILTITREDYWSGFCSPEFTNTTLDFTLFDFGNGNLQNLTLTYGCALSSIAEPRQLTCSTTTGSLFDVHMKWGALGPDENCETSVIIPVRYSESLDTLDWSKLEQSMKEGFDVKLKVDSSACRNCIKSDGVCGYDLKLNQEMCYSQSKPGSTGLPFVQTPKFKILIGASAGVVGIIVLSVVMICYLRREQLSIMIVMKKKNTTENQYAKAFIKNQGSLQPKRYSYSEIRKMTNSFKEKLGQGGYGSVYKGKLLDGRLVAVKVIKELKGSGEEFINEVASISRTSHVNIVTLLGYCYGTSKRALVYEFMPKGSLDKFINNQGPSGTNCQLEREALFQIAVGVARGLEYLHRGCSIRILHFDIKPQNILLDEDLCPKISDFGLARLCQRKDSIVSMLGTRGTIGYIAPEVFSRGFGGVSYKADVYSYGMLVLEMLGKRKNLDIGASLTNEKYFPDWIYQELNLVENVGNNIEMAEEVEEMEWKMILVSLWCIQSAPTDRPSMTKVVEMLEGRLQSIEIPPKPFLSSSKMSPPKMSTSMSIQNSSTTSMSI